MSTAEGFKRMETPISTGDLVLYFDSWTTVELKFVLQSEAGLCVSHINNHMDLVEMAQICWGTVLSATSLEDGSTSSPLLPRKPQSDIQYVDTKGIKHIRLRSSIDEDSGERKKRLFVMSSLLNASSKVPPEIDRASQSQPDVLNKIREASRQRYRMKKTSSSMLHLCGRDISYVAPSPSSSNIIGQIFTVTKDEVDPIAKEGLVLNEDEIHVLTDDGDTSITIKEALEDEVPIDVTTDKLGKLVYDDSLSDNIQTKISPLEAIDESLEPKQVNNNKNYSNNEVLELNVMPPFNASVKASSSRSHSSIRRIRIMKQHSSVKLRSNTNKTIVSLRNSGHFGKEQPYIPPVIDMNFIDENHPRATYGKTYSICSTHTGRFSSNYNNYDNNSNNDNVGCVGISSCCKRIITSCCFLNPFREDSASDLYVFGLGIVNYFKLLKWCGLIFFRLFIISLPILYLNIKLGSNFENQVVDGDNIGSWLSNVLLSVPSTTLGNIGTMDLINNTYVNDTIPLIHVFPSQIQPWLCPIITTSTPSTTTNTHSPCSISREMILLLYVIFDSLGVLMFLFAYFKLKRYEKPDQNTSLGHHGDYITAADFTVYVTNLPKDTDKNELKTYIEQLFDEPIHDIFFGMNNGDLIQLYFKRGKVLKKYHEAYANVLKTKNEAYSNKKALHIQKRTLIRDRLLQQLFSIDKELSAFRSLHTVDSVTSAFVVFCRRCGVLKALDFKPYRRRLPQHERFQKKWSLHFNPSLVPSTVLWENLQYSYTSRISRRLLITLFVFLFSFISAFGVFLSIWARYNVQNSSQTWLNEITFDFNAGNEYDNLNCTNLEKLLNSNQTIDFQSTYNASEIQSICQCYHSSSQNPIFQSNNNNNNNNTSMTNYHELCSNGIESVFSVLFVLASSFVIVIVNAASNFILKKLAGLEKHRSISTLERSISVRIFFVQFLNTAITILFVVMDFSYWNTPDNSNNNESSVNELTRYKDFPPGWYETVGTKIILTMVISIFSPHLFPSFIWVYTTIRRKFYWQHCASQDSLNELFLGPQFFLSTRFANILVILYVSLLYSSGMPILYLIASIAFFAAYWVDKVMFLRFYRRPPVLDSKHGEDVSKLFPIAVFLHLCMSVLAFSQSTILPTRSQSLFTSNDNNNILVELVLQTGKSDIFTWSRYDKPQLYPIYLLSIIALVIATMFLYSGENSFIMKYIRPWSSVTWDYGYEFKDALSEYIFSDIPSYNILTNPYYKAAFAVTDEFALSHRHVHSIGKENDLWAKTMNNLKQIEHLRRGDSASSSASSSNPTNGGTCSHSTSTTMRSANTNDDQLLKIDKSPDGNTLNNALSFHEKEVKYSSLSSPRSPLFPRKEVNMVHQGRFMRAVADVAISPPISPSVRHRYKEGYNNISTAGTDTRSCAHDADGGNDNNNDNVALIDSEHNDSSHTRHKPRVIGDTHDILEKMS